MGYPAEPLEKYLTDAASSLPAPGGGSVSALAGALAASMGEMAANFTVGKKKFKDVEPEVSDCLQRLEGCRGRLMGLMEADIEAYGALSAAYKMARGTDAEKTARDEAIQAALRDAMKVPLNIMRQCRTIAQTSARLVETANPNLITDVGVSAILAEAACAAARLNVEVNLKWIRDRDLVREVQPELEQVTAELRRCREEVSQRVRENLSG